MRSTPGAAIGGHTLNGVPGNLFAEASQCLISFLYRYYNADPDAVHFLTSNNLAVPVERFHELGGFDESFRLAAGEDRDFCDRWVNRGWPMRYTQAAIVSHEHRMGPVSFWRQHFNYGRGAHHFRTLRAARGHEPVRVEPMGFYVGVFKAAFHEQPALRAFAIAALMGMAQLANAAGYFLAASGSKTG